MRLQYIGRPRTWRDADTGNLVSDLDSIHRTDALEGDFDEFGADLDDFDEFGDDDSDEDFGDDDSSDEDFGDDDSSDDDDSDEDFGATRGRRRRKARRQKRRTKRKSRRQARRSGGKSKRKVPMQKTVISGDTTGAAAGAVTIIITPAHKFKAKDIVFNGSSASATITSITFGDNLIWNNASGVDQSVFSTSSYIRGLIEGAKAVPGVPIVINGTVANAGDILKATLFGLKPGRVC